MLYSNVYFDFHVKELQNYNPATTSAWSAVISEAFLGIMCRKNGKKAKGTRSSSSSIDPEAGVD